MTGDTTMLAAWLRSQRETRGWSRPDMARRLIRIAHAHDDNTVPGLDSMTHNIYRWERGHDAPSERYRLLYRAALGTMPPAPPRQPPPATPAPSAITLTITIHLPPGLDAHITATQQD
jgi:hypothetical protein